MERKTEPEESLAEGSAQPARYVGAVATKAA